MKANQKSKVPPADILAYLRALREERLNALKTEVALQEIAQEEADMELDTIEQAIAIIDYVDRNRQEIRSALELQKVHRHPVAQATLQAFSGAIIENISTLHRES